MVKGRTYEIKPAADSEVNLLYSNQGKDADLGCIGYLRADFGRDGKGFWTTWFDRCADLKTQEFKDELDEVINHLRESGNMLGSFAALARYCYDHNEARLGDGHRKDTYGFRIDTDNHSYFLRGMLTQGDYNLYCFTYQRDKLEQYLAQWLQKQTPEGSDQEPELSPEIKMDGM
jgi:hypothetical protein